MWSFRELPHSPGIVLGPNPRYVEQRRARHPAWPDTIYEKCFSHLSTNSVQCLLSPLRFSPTRPAVYPAFFSEVCTRRRCGRAAGRDTNHSHQILNTDAAPHCARLSNVVLDWSILQHPGFVANHAAPRRVLSLSRFRKEHDGDTLPLNPHPALFTALHLFAAVASLSCEVPMGGFLALRLSLALADAAKAGTRGDAASGMQEQGHNGLVFFLGPHSWPWAWFVATGWHGVVFQALGALAELLPPLPAGTNKCRLDVAASHVRESLRAAAYNASAAIVLRQPGMATAESAARACAPPSDDVTLLWVVREGRALWRALAELPWLPGRPGNGAFRAGFAWRHLSPAPFLDRSFKAAAKKIPHLGLCDDGRPLRYRLRAGVVATILGASFLEPRSKSDSQPSWVLEVAMFVHGGDDGCVLMVDEYVCATEPQSLLVQWECDLTVWSGGTSRRLSVAATVYSSRQEEAIVQCWISPNHWPEGGVTAAAVSLVPTRRDLLDWAVRDVPLCLKEPKDESKRVAMCSRPRYGLTDAGTQSALRQWMRYHNHIGIDHFFLYDHDGSVMEALPPELRGQVTYTPNFTSFFGRNYADVQWGNYRCGGSPDDLSEKCDVHGYVNPRFDSCLTVAAYTHCLYRSRGFVDFLIIAHSVDVYLSSSGNGVLRDIHAHAGVLEAARLARSNLAMISVPMLRFGGPLRSNASRTSRQHLRAVPIAFEYREAQPACDEQYLEFTTVRYLCEGPQSFLVPEQILSVTGEHWPTGRPGTLHVDGDQEVMHFKHYNSLHMLYEDFGLYQKMGLRGPCDECVVLDRSIFWARGLLEKWAED